MVWVLSYFPSLCLNRNAIRSLGRDERIVRRYVNSDQTSSSLWRTACHFSYSSCRRDVALLQVESLDESIRFANNGNDMSLTMLAVSVRKHRHTLIFKQGRFCKEVLRIPRSATNTAAESELGKKKQEREYAGLCCKILGWAIIMAVRAYGRKGDRCFSSRHVLQSCNK